MTSTAQPLPRISPPALHTVSAGDWLFDPSGDGPSAEAVEALADQLWERKAPTGRHLVVYGLASCFEGEASEARLGAFLDRWALESYDLHLRDHGARAEMSTADRPLGGLQGSLDYVKSFLPSSRRRGELEDLRRGLRFQGQLLQRDLAAICDLVGRSKAAYLESTAPIVDETLDSIKMPHCDAGTTVSILRVQQQGVSGGRSQLIDLRALLAYLQACTGQESLSVLDLLAPVRKQGVYRGQRYGSSVVLGLRPEFQGAARAFTLTIPDPDRATTFFVNDVYDRVTGRLSGLLHGAEAPCRTAGVRPAKRRVMNRSVLAKIA